MILVIADDLTGCGDIAYWLLEKDCSVRVYTNEDALYKDVDAIDVRIVNADTRHKSSCSAYDTVRRICDWARHKNINKIFKKMDSTLRGNFAIENDAVIDAFCIKYLPMLVAYPEYNRVTRRGIHYINDIEISKTEFANDPKSPVTESNIFNILKAHSKNYSFVKVYDANTVDDVNNVSREVFRSWRDVEYEIATGSSRFFGSLVNLWIKNGKKERIIKYKFDKIFVLSASKNSVTYKQIEKIITLNNFVKNKIDGVGYHFSSDKIEILQTLDEFIPKYDINIFAEYAKDILNKNDFLCIICGGDTSNAVLKNMRIEQLDVVEKVGVGIVMCKFDKNFWILKSGGFGDEDFIKRFAEEK